MFKTRKRCESTRKYAALILFTVIHEVGHWTFFKFSCDLNEEKHSPCGILMEEPGDAIECFLFGFRIQHYGAAHPKLQIDDIIMKTSGMRQYRIVPDEYLQSLFQAKTDEGDLLKENISWMSIILNVLVVIDLSSLRIQKEVILSSRVLDEEQMKFQEKRVFDATDEFQLFARSNNVTIG
ncbi:unnamed protein product [Rotaria magnacalcarata]|uniref:Uncharacterized protein n=1 Tax=Rotaria magnacalcarata TaxID=392030 RepID=A0A816S6F7_9BILA|nr:unnamed protein product [Rotaria magnacalcarata]CAF4174116.1 unnamed protein product [Rotaria magnacalcarata]